MSTNRVPAGVPSGGQFAQSTKGEAGVGLGSTTPCAHEELDPDGVCEYCGHYPESAAFGDDPVDGAYPNGRCPSCGHGLDEGRRCFQVDCSRFDEGSPYANDGHTTSGDSVSTVTPGSLRTGDRVILKGVYGVVTSIDNDHRTTSIELDGDPDTIASYDNDTYLYRYDGDPHPMPGDMVYFTDPDDDNTGWYKVDTFGLDEVVLRSRTGKVYPVAVEHLSSAPAQVFGPDRERAARAALAAFRQAEINREANPWSDAAADEYRQAKRVRDQYSEYGDSFLNR